MASSKKESTSKKDAYWNISSNHDPLMTAVLYSSFKDPVDCGHSVPLKPMISRLQGGDLSCPICKHTVSHVADGLASKKEQSVVFKFGKIIYRLTVPSADRLRPWWMFWENDTPGTAQDRIASVLGISRGMKILCKGKVLYSLNTVESSSDDAKQELSQTLVQLSVGAMPSLVVMGTPSQTQDDWLASEQKYQQLTHDDRDILTILTTVTVSDVVQFTMYIVQQSIRWTTHAVWHSCGIVRDTLFGWMGGNDSNSNASQTDSSRD